MKERNILKTGIIIATSVMLAGGVTYGSFMAIEYSKKNTENTTVSAVHDNNNISEDADIFTKNNSETATLMSDAGKTDSDALPKKNTASGKTTETATQKATTESSVRTTEETERTETPSTEAATERNTTETPTTEAVTERPTTESPTTTEASTTERPTTETPTTEETTECRHDWVAQYETKTEKIEVESAWDEEITERRSFCSYCGKDTTGDTYHISNCGEYYYSEFFKDWIYAGASDIIKSVVVDVIHHPAKYETKKTKVLIGYKCSKCGATK